MFYFENFYGYKILKSTLLKNVDAFFTTRDFVLTPKNLTELEPIAEKNRLILTEKLGVNEITTSNQTHSNNVQVVSSGIYFYDDTDSLISDIPDSLLLMNFADCVPIILYSEYDNTGAVVHAGWRGTSKEIAVKTVEEMEKELNINPKNITALIGPAIGKCCFETNEDVFLQLVKNRKSTELYEKSGEKYYIDLKLLNKNQLINSGVSSIDMCDYCTCCMSDIFFSYRKEKGNTARHSAILKIKRG